MSKNRVLSHGMMIWICLTLFFCYQYILRILPGLIMPALVTQFKVGAEEFGNFAGIYYVGYVIMHIPIGVLLSRFGGRIILPVCIILTFLGLLPLMYCQTWSYVMIGRLITGVGSSAAVVGALQMFQIIFPQNFSRMLGAMICAGLLTTVYASKPLAEIINSIGINKVINILIIIGLGLSMMTFCLLPGNIIANSAKSSVWLDLKGVIGNYRLIIVSILAGLMVGPLQGFADSWGSTFISAVHVIDLSTASSIVSKILLGDCLGCLLLPYIAEKTNSYYGLTIISALGMTGGFIYLLLSSGNANSLTMICLIIGIFAAYQVVIMPKITSFVPENLSGIAGAVANMIIMAFGGIFNSIIGMVIGRLSDKPLGQDYNNLTAFDKNAYLTGIALIPSAMIIAGLGLAVIIIIESKNQRRHSKSLLDRS